MRLKIEVAIMFLIAMFVGLVAAQKEPPRVRVEFSRLTSAVAAEGVVEIQGSADAIADTVKRLESAGFRIDEKNNASPE